MNFDELTQVAMLGTERQGLTAPSGERLLEQALRQVDLNRREEALLASAALCACHERAGALPAKDVGLVPDPCPQEALARMNDQAGAMLLRLLGGDFAVLLQELLELAAKAQQLAVPEALPALLSLGFAKAELREAILPVLGERGRWLATQNVDWAWVGGATGEDENIWQVGEPSARLAFLQCLRRTNPARARELLASTWTEETPEDRSRFVTVFEIGLNLEDEAFLEAALDDKRKEVRRGASALLGRLPNSRLRQRMAARTQPLLKFIPAESGSLLRLKKGKPASIEVTLPAECDKGMLRDGIEPKPPQGLGEKAWWLMQMLEFVPLELWTTAWGIGAAEILAASLAGDWKQEFLLAWARAAIRQKDAVWADALFGGVFDARHFNLLGDLLSVMSLTARESRLAELLASTDAKTREFQGTLLVQCRFGWSVPFSRAALTWLRRHCAEPSTDWQFRGQIKDFASCLAPVVLPEAAQGWPTDKPGWEFWAKGVDEFLAVAQFRADMHTVFTH